MDALNAYSSSFVLLKEDGQVRHQISIPSKVGVDKKGLRKVPPELTALYNAENESRAQQLRANIENWKSGGAPPKVILTNSIEVSAFV